MPNQILTPFVSADAKPAATLENDGSVFSTNKWILFVLICLLSTVITYASSTLLVNENLLAAFYGSQMSDERIHQLVQTQEKYAWLTGPLTVVMYAIRIISVGCFISLGLFFANKQHRIGQVFGLVTLAELVLLIPAGLKLVWFLFVNTHYSIHDLQLFAPLSLLNLFSPDALDRLLVYPFQLMNVFELLYASLIAFGLYKYGYIKNFGESAKIVGFSYGAALVFWVLVITFINLTI